MVGRRMEAGGLGIEWRPFFEMLPESEELASYAPHEDPQRRPLVETNFGGRKFRAAPARYSL